MPRSSRRLRRRPFTPNLHQQTQAAFTAEPASPPETPVTSPQFSRKTSLKPRHQPDFTNLADDPNIKPVGNHQFSYRPRLGPEQLSPRLSSSGSSVAVEDEENDEEEDESEGSLQNAPINRSRYEIFLQRKTQSESSDSDADEDNEDEDDDGEQDSKPPTASTMWDLLLEELDPMDHGGFEALEVLYPYEVESVRSRSSSWHKDRPGHVDRGMMRDFNNLNCSAEASSSSEDEDDGLSPDFDEAEEAFMRHQAARRSLRRLSMTSSVGKRTHSELSDSEDDRDPLDVNEAGSSARRLRRKRLHRGSLLFQDPPEQIVELDEPASSEDERKAVRPGPWSSLAQELPYWSMEIFEIE